MSPPDVSCGSSRLSTWRGGAIVQCPLAATRRTNALMLARMSSSRSDTMKKSNVCFGWSAETTFTMLPLLGLSVGFLAPNYAVRYDNFCLMRERPDTGQCPVVALPRHHEAVPSCLLPGVKRSYRKHRLRPESDREPTCPAFGGAA